MSDPFHNQPFPRKVLYAVGALLAFSIILAAFARITGVGVSQAESSPVVHSADLHFEDRTDGAVLVYSAQDRTLVTELPPASNGFIRGVMRSLVRARRAANVGDDVPFRLARHANGRLTVEDLATHRIIQLSSFGPTNEGAFAALLGERERTATP